MLTAKDFPVGQRFTKHIRQIRAIDNSVFTATLICEVTNVTEDSIDYKGLNEVFDPVTRYTHGLGGGMRSGAVPDCVKFLHMKLIKPKAKSDKSKKTFIIGTKEFGYDSLVKKHSGDAEFIAKIKKLRVKKSFLHGTRKLEVIRVA